MDKIAEVAFETANFTKGSKSLAAAIDPQTALSLEAYSNLGRIFGINLAARIDFLNSLVLAGAGGRYGAKLGKSLTGSKIKDILVIAALDVSKGIELSKATSKHVDGFLATLRKAAIDTVAAPVAVPMRRPAATVPILLRGQEELDEETRFGPQSSREPPIGPPTLASRTPPAPARPPVAGSTLAQASPFDRLAARPPQQFAATGAPRPETMAGLAEVGLPLFPAFASKGGLASLKKKKKSRQMVY